MKSCAAAACGGRDHLVQGGIRLAEGDILADRAGEEGGLLQHDADLRAQRV